MVTAAAADPIAEAAHRAFEGREVRIEPERPITSAYLHRLAAKYEGLWFEEGRRGELIISGAPGGYTRYREAELFGQIRDWAKVRAPRFAFHTSGGYHPPGGRRMIPDASWASPETQAAIDRLSAEERRDGFYPVTPDFILEVRSPSQRLADQQEKMEDWARAGVALGVLVDGETQTVWLYRPDGDGFAVEEFAQPSRVPCEPEMPGLVLEFDLIWTFPWE